MEFTEMRDLLIENFNKLQENVTHMYQVLVDKDEMYNLYLDSFPDGTNEIYRERREHDCSCCRGFIKSIGNAVFIIDGEIKTIWDFKTNDTTYQPVLDTLNKFILDKINENGIEDVYLSIEKKIGCHHNFEMLEAVGSKQWDHFYLELPDKFVIRNGRSKGDILGDFRDTRNVFKRSLDEITLDSVEMILELIAQNSLYKGDEWKNQLNEFKKLKKEYGKLTNNQKELFAWEQSTKVGAVIGRIRNHSIGTLLTNVSEGMDLDLAVKKYEQIVAPSNYKRSKPIFTQKMLDDAQKKITNLGYLESLPRRYAKLDDITVNDILFSNKDAAKRIDGAMDVFGELSKQAKGGNVKKFSKVEEISVEKFIEDVLPDAKELELYFENKHSSNMVSLIAPKNLDSKSMFKWGNNFGWAYSGNLTDSDMKERVKSAGGSVTGDLRFSIQWNESGRDNCDLDAHCIEPDKYEIYYGNKKQLSHSKGMLDVDIISPGNEIAVENITYANRNNMKDGIYRFFVHQYSGSVKDGFRAEIEFDGQIYSFDYPHSMRSGESVVVATVTLKNGEFTIKEELNSSVTSKEIWGIKTNEFVPVSVVCYSPNWWETAEKNNGHKHVFFMLKDCINDENPSGMFNEFLVQELYEHRKVMEALGSKMRCEDTDDQLSGVGFATDKRAEVIVKVIGATERIIKIKF